MSYCRWNGIDSDVYVIATYYQGKEAWDCICCSIATNNLMGLVHTRQEMLDHLLEHRLVGNRVPQYAIDRLQKEILQNNLEIK